MTTKPTFFQQAAMLALAITFLGLSGCATTPEGEPGAGWVLLDIVGKMAGGVAAGMGEPPGGNSAMAAQRYVRNVQRDQQSARAIRQEELASAAPAQDYANSYEQDVALAARREIYGVEAPPEILAKIRSMSAAEIYAHSATLPPEKMRVFLRHLASPILAHDDAVATKMADMMMRSGGDPTVDVEAQINSMSANQLNLAASKMPPKDMRTYLMGMASHPSTVSLPAYNADDAMRSRRIEHVDTMRARRLDQEDADAREDAHEETLRAMRVQTEEIRQLREQSRPPLCFQSQTGPASNRRDVTICDGVSYPHSNSVR